MKTSDSLVDRTRSILILGPPGGGKTTFVLQWPNVWIADCDMNLAGPVKWLKKAGLYRPFKYDTIPYDDDGKPLPLAQWWPRLVKKTREALADPTVQIVVVDSLTQVDNMLVEYTMATQGVKVMEIQHWRPFRRDLHDYILSSRSRGKTFVMLGHEEILTDRQGGVLGYRPSVSTKIADYFGYYFTDIWRCQITLDAGNKLRARVRTHPNALCNLKNSLLLPTEIDATWVALEPYMQEILSAASAAENTETKTQN